MESSLSTPAGSTLQRLLGQGRATTEDRSLASPESSLSSPLHLSLPSARAAGQASRLITSECRIPTQDENDPSYSPQTPSYNFDLPYDTSYPSIATVSSSRPRGILRRALSRAPPNTPESTINLNSPPRTPLSKSVRFQDPHGSPSGRQRSQRRDPSPFPSQLEGAYDVFSHFEPLPQPEYDVVRPWLKGVINRTGIQRSQSAPVVFASTVLTEESTISSYLDTPLASPPRFHSSAKFDCSNHSAPLWSDDASDHLAPSPTERSDSDSDEDVRFAWSQLELELDDPECSFEPIIGRQDALAALWEYGSDHDGSFSGSAASPGSALDPEAEEEDGEVDLGVEMDSPVLATPRLNSIALPPQSPGTSPKLPTKFASPLPQRYLSRSQGEFRISLSPTLDTDTSRRVTVSSLLFGPSNRIGERFLSVDWTTSAQFQLHPPHVAHNLVCMQWYPVVSTGRSTSQSTCVLTP